MRRALIQPKRDEEGKFFLMRVKGRNCPRVAQTQRWGAPRQSILINSGQLLPKIFKGLGKRCSGHWVLIFSTSQTRDDALEGGKTSFCQERRTNQGWISASVCSFPSKTTNDVINTGGKKHCHITRLHWKRSQHPSDGAFCHDHKQRRRPSLPGAAGATSAAGLGAFY